MTLYSLLGQALSPPSDGLGAGIRDGTFQSALREVLAEFPGIDGRGLPPRVAALGSAPPPAGFTEAFAAEWTRLQGTDLVCPHYESDYVCSHAFMKVHTIADVAGFYAAWGLRVADAAAERADHIAVELEFMGLLAAKEAHALARGERDHARLCRRAQAKFVAEHLGRWGRPFARALRASTRLAFLEDLAALLEWFLDAEARALGLAIEDLERECASLPIPGQPATAGTNVAE